MSGMKRLLEQYPDHPGFKDKGDTSQEAANSVAGRAKALREAVLLAVQHRPRTADEVADALSMSVLTIRPRLSELRATNKIAKTGERRRNASGKMAAVWRVV